MLCAVGVTLHGLEAVELDVADLAVEGVLVSLPLDLLLAVPPLRGDHSLVPFALEILVSGFPVFSVLLDEGRSRFPVLEIVLVLSHLIVFEKFIFMTNVHMVHVVIIIVHVVLRRSSKAGNIELC